MLLPTRTTRLQAALFLLFKPPTNHNKINFPFSNISHLLLFLLLRPSLSGCRALKDAKNSPPHTFSRHPSRVSPPKISKTFLTLSLKCLLYQLDPLNICTTSFFFPFSLGIPHHQPWNSNLLNSSFSHEVGNCLS